MQATTDIRISFKSQTFQKSQHTSGYSPIARLEAGMLELNAFFTNHILGKSLNLKV